jgi:predicted aspartyl protease
MPNCSMRRIKRLLILTLAFYSVIEFFPSAKASEASAGSGVSLSRSTGNHLFVLVRVNKRPAWFAVDTGAALSIVDTEKAKLLGLSLSNRKVRVPRQIEVNSRVVPVALIGNLQVGSNDLGSGPVALIDLREFRARLRGSGDRVTMDGIIGLDILQRYNAVIDCRDQRIYLDTPGGDSRAIVEGARRNRYKSVPMRITKSGALEVEGRIGRNRYSFVVDTGGFTTLIPAGVALESGIQVIGTTVHAKGIHASERPVGVALVPELDLGKNNLGPALVGVTGLPEGPDDLRFKFGGLIGADFFFERGGIIDVGNKILYFK